MEILNKIKHLIKKLIGKQVDSVEEVAEEIKKRYSDQGDRITPAFYSGEEGLASRVISALRS